MSFHFFSLIRRSLAMNTPNSAGSIAARLRSPIETLQQLRLSISNRDSPASPPSGTLPTANEEQSIEDIQSQPSSPSFSSAAAQFVKIETNVLTVMRALTLSEKGSECIAYGVLTKIIQCMEEHSETFVTMTEELKLHRRRGAGGSESRRCRRRSSTSTKTPDNFDRASTVASTRRRSNFGVQSVI